MPGWLVQVQWWGLVDGYPSTTWKTIETHNDEDDARISAIAWRTLHGKTTAYRVVQKDPENAV